MPTDASTTELALTDLWAETPLALFVDGPARGKLVPVKGPFEVHVEDGVEYHVVPRGASDWVFPIHYRLATSASGVLSGRKG
jgi:hypothetical protein